MKTVNIWRVAGMKVCAPGRTWMETEACRPESQVEDCPSRWAQSNTRQPITTSNHSVHRRQPNWHRISVRGAETAAKHSVMCKPPSHEHPGALGILAGIETRSKGFTLTQASHRACATFHNAKQSVRTRNLSSGTGHLTSVSWWRWNYPACWVKTPSRKCQSIFQ